MPAPPPKQRSLAGRIWSGLKLALSVVALSLLFVLGATAGLVAHLNSAAGRRAAATFLGRTLVDLFQGQVSIGSISKLSPREVVAEDIVVRDPDHRVVLKVSRLTATADVLDIALRIVRGDEKLTIVIDHVRVERAEAEILPGSDGVPTIAHAFTPRPTPDTGAPSAAERYVRVWLPAVEIGQGYARGHLADTPTLEAELKAVHGSLLATPKGAAIDIARFSLLARGVGGADAKGVASLHIRAPGAVWSTFDGYIGDVQFGSAVRWDKEILDLKLDLPRAEPAAARALFAQWPLLVPAEARAHARGRLPELDVEIEAKVGDSATLDATGNLRVAAPLHLQLEVEGRRLDLRAVLAQAPPTSIDLQAEVGVLMENGEPVLELGGSVQPLVISNVEVPALDFTSGSKNGILTGQAKLHDLGLPINLDFAVFSDGKIELNADAKHVNLANVARLKPYFDGSGNADMRLHAVFERGRLDSSVTLDARNLGYQGALLQSGRLSATLRGPLAHLDQLALDAHVTGKRLSAWRFAFEDVSGSFRGPLRAPLVTAVLKDAHGPSFDARATVNLGRPISIRGLTVGVSRDNVEVRGEVAQLDLAEDRVLVRDLRLHGATGELNGNAELRPDALSVTAQGQNLDLSAISRLIGLPRGVLEGRASLAVDAVASGKTQRGTLELSISKAAIANLNGISGQLSAKLDGHQLSGASTGTVEGLGGFSSEWDTRLAGPLSDRRSFERAIGSLSLSLNNVTLDYLGQLLPEQGLDFGGQATLSAQLTRSDPDAVPNLELSGETHGLSVRYELGQQPPLVLSGLELLGSATHDGSTGNTTAAVTVARGSERLLTTSADLTLDLKAARLGQRPLAEQLKTQPILAKVVVARVELESLPEPLRPASLRGAVRLEGTVRGSLGAPIVSLGARATDLRFSAGERGEPIDACGTAEYAQQSGAFNVVAEAFLPGSLELARTPCAGRRIATLQVRGQAPFDLRRGPSTWSGTASASLEALPLATIPQLARARVTGTTTGTLILDRSGQEPSASGQLQLQSLRMDQLEIGDGTLKVRSDANHARIDFQVERGKTTLRGSAKGGVSWASEAPALDDTQPIDLELSAQKLDASVLEPFLADFLSELHGNVDGEVSARLQPLAPDEGSRQIEQVSGKVAFDKGSFVLTALGFRLRDVRFSANAKRDGKTTLVEIPDLVASAGSKSPNLKAQLGLRLRGFDIVSGSASFNVDSLPLVVDGVTRANADVRVSQLSIKRNPDLVLVEVPFDHLAIRLPDESSRELIELTENENITLLQPIAQPKAARNDASLPWQFAIHLGDDARVKRREQLDIPIAGDPNVVLAAGVGVTGSIMLPRRGSVQMLGRLFQIEGGAIVFDTPEPTDPRLDVRASWRSSTNDTLFMYISGTISKPKVQFDRPQADAVALLAGTTESGNSATNVGISALDSLLADTPLARVQLRGKDSDESGKGATYTAAYRASDRIVVEGNYRAGGNTGASDTAPGQGSVVGAAVDYRVTKTISVRGQLGTIGTGVDLVYQYRY